MTDSLSKAAGGGATIELRGKLFKIKPLTIGDLSDFESHIRSKKIRDFMAAAEDVSPLERVAILKELASEPLEEAELTAGMASMSGVQYLLWKALSKSQPDLELSDMNEYIDLQNLEELSAIVQGLGGGGSDDENPPEKTEASD